MSLRKIICIFFFIQIQHQINCTISETRTFSKNIVFFTPETIISYGKPIFSQNLIFLPHVECSNFTDECKVSQETYLFDNPASASDRKICPLRFPQKTDLATTDIDVIQLGKDKIIIHMKQASIYVIRMINCELREIDIKINSFVDPIAHILPYSKDSRFDFFYTNSDLCNQGRVRETYNSDGILIAGPFCILDRVPSLTSTFNKIGTDVVGISDDEYFFLDRNRDHWSGYILQRNNDREQMVLQGRSEYNRFLQHRISTNHNRITLCWLPGADFYSTVTCSYSISLRDQQKNLLLNFPHEVRTFEVHNLPNEEFLAVTSRYHYEEDIGNIKMEIYDLWRFKSDGSYVSKPTEIVGLSCHKPWQRSRVLFSEQRQNEVCISFQCKDQNLKIIGENDDETETFGLSHDFKFLTKCLRVD